MTGNGSAAVRLAYSAFFLSDGRWTRRWREDVTLMALFCGVLVGNAPEPRGGCVIVSKMMVVVVVVVL